MRHVFTATVKPGLIDEYLAYHDAIWPEVAAGLRQAGILHLHIWRVPATSDLVMTIETAGVDLSEATGPASLYRCDPKCAEWEELMDGLHGGWNELTKVHASDSEWNTALALPLVHRFYVTKPEEEKKVTEPAASRPVNTTHRQFGPIAFAAGVLCGMVLLTGCRRVLAK